MLEELEPSETLRAFLRLMPARTRAKRRLSWLSRGMSGRPPIATEWLVLIEGGHIRYTLKAPKPLAGAL